MKFKVTTFWLNPRSGVVEPVSEGVFMDFPSLEIVRNATMRFVTRDSFPGYSLAIESDWLRFRALVLAQWRAEAGRCLKAPEGRSGSPRRSSALS